MNCGEQCQKGLELKKKKKKKDFLKIHYGRFACEDNTTTLMSFEVLIILKYIRLK